MDTKVETVDTVALVRLAPVIRSELRKLAYSSARPAQDALEHVFQQLFGERSRQEQIRFMVYAAPMARRLAIGMANPNDRVPETDVTVRDIQEWLGWLDMFDPLCARMIDLHYFAGLTTKETAQALRMPAQSVIRDLRFAKAWLRAKLIY